MVVLKRQTGKRPLIFIYFMVNSHLRRVISGSTAFVFPITSIGTLNCIQLKRLKNCKIDLTTEVDLSVLFALIVFVTFVFVFF